MHYIFATLDCSDDDIILTKISEKPPHRCCCCFVVHSCTPVLIGLASVFRLPQNVFSRVPRPSHTDAFRVLVRLGALLVSCVGIAVMND